MDPENEHKTDMSRPPARRSRAPLHLPPPCQHSPGLARRFPPHLLWLGWVGLFRAIQAFRVNASGFRVQRFWTCGVQGVEFNDFRRSRGVNRPGFYQAPGRRRSRPRRRVRGRARLPARPPPRGARRAALRAGASGGTLRRRRAARGGVLYCTTRKLGGPDGSSENLVVALLFHTMFGVSGATMWV